MKHFYTFILMSIFVISLSVLTFANPDYEKYVAEKRAELRQINVLLLDAVGKIHDILDDVAVAAGEQGIKAVDSRETTLLSIEVAEFLIGSEKPDSVSMGISMLSTIREDVSKDILTPEILERIAHSIVVGIERAKILNAVTIMED